MTDKSMPIVYKHEMPNEADFEDQISFRNLKIQKFSKNCNGTERRKPKRSTLGISAFTTNDTTPNADRFIAKRRGRDSNALISQIIKKESAVDEINRNDFEDMDEYEEKKESNKTVLIIEI